MVNTIISNNAKTTGKNVAIEAINVYFILLLLQKYLSKNNILIFFVL